jgi:Sec-independent protein secretion pathway component TatC
MTLLAGIGAIELGILVSVAAVVLVVTSFTSKRWLWASGLVGCVAFAVAVTPADPMSTLLFAVPCCGLYVLSAFAWNATGKMSEPARQ